MILEVSIYANKNKMAKCLQLKIIYGEATCKEALYKPRPQNAKIKKTKGNKR